MLKLISGLSLFGLLLSMGIVNIASAQIVDTVDVDVPFSFVVDGTKLPAGTYGIKPVDDVEAGDNLMQIDNSNGHLSVIFTANASIANTVPKETTVLFNNYEGTRYLAGVYVTGRMTGITLPPGHWEKVELKHGKKPVVERHTAKKR